MTLNTPPPQPDIRTWLQNNLTHTEPDTHSLALFQTNKWQSIWHYITHHAVSREKAALIRFVVQTKRQTVSKAQFHLELYKALHTGIVPTAGAVGFSQSSMDDVVGAGTNGMLSECARLDAEIQRAERDLLHHQSAREQRTQLTGKLRSLTHCMHRVEKDMHTARNAAANLAELRSIEMQFRDHVHTVLHESLANAKTHCANQVRCIEDDFRHARANYVTQCTHACRAKEAAACRSAAVTQEMRIDLTIPLLFANGLHGYASDIHNALRALRETLKQHQERGQNEHIHASDIAACRENIDCIQAIKKSLADLNAQCMTTMLSAQSGDGSKNAVKTLSSSDGATLPLDLEFEYSADKVQMSIMQHKECAASFENELDATRPRINAALSEIGKNVKKIEAFVCAWRTHVVQE